MVITPKVFANSSPGLEQSDNPGIDSSNIFLTLKGLLSRRTLSGLNQLVVRDFPELSLRSNSGLELSNAFGVYLETDYFKIRLRCWTQSVQGAVATWSVIGMRYRSWTR